MTCADYAPCPDDYESPTTVDIPAFVAPEPDRHNRAMHTMTADELLELKTRIGHWARQLGLHSIGIADTELSAAEGHLQTWLARGFHGDMDYMQRHGSKRTRPAELVSGTVRVICARLDYLPAEPDPRTLLTDPAAAVVSRYALGRDYHKVLRQRLQQLATRIAVEIGEFGYRVFVDSAPVMEKALAAKAGLGWIGKHSNLLARDAGSWFFLGEIYTDLPLPPDTPVGDHCGECQRCIALCPTGAIVAPYQVDARRCISYLTIELQGAIPVELRPLIGNRIYGCDDCQQVCPWNRFAQLTEIGDFAPRHGLDRAALLTLFAWDEAEFLQRTEGSPIRRIGHVRWLRNIAVALGNGTPNTDTITALQLQRDHPSELVREHIEWALQRLCGQ